MRTIIRFKIPQTLDHCDFHSNNILIVNETQEMIIIDWGETVITHPFFSLITCLKQASFHHSLNETDEIYLKLQGACLKNWLPIIPKDKLLDAFILAKNLWPIYAALGFYRLMMSSDADEFNSYFKDRPSRLTGYFKEFIKMCNPNGIMGF